MILNFLEKQENIPNMQQASYQDVATIITAMTEGERPFLYETVEAVLADPNIGQAVLCVAEENEWLNNVLASLANDSRLEIVRMPMAPLAAVRNKGLEYVKLPWVAYCDGDDVWCRDKIQAQRACADRLKADFVGSDHFLTDEMGRIRARAMAWNIPMPSSWLVRSEVMKRHPFDESILVGEDGDWWINTVGTVSKARCPQLLLRYRVRAGSLSSKSPSKKRKARTIDIASMPLLGATVMLATCCMWLFTRRNFYIWLDEWGKKPNIGLESI